MEQYIKDLIKSLNNTVDSLKENNKVLNSKINILSSLNKELTDKNKIKIDEKSQKILLDAQENSKKIIIQSLNLASKFKNDISVLLDNMKENVKNPKQLLDVIEKYITENTNIYKYDFKNPEELNIDIKNKIYKMIKPKS